MLNAVIIEDERPALENLVEAINSLSDDVHIEARLSTVRDSIDYLQTEPPIDLIFSDVQLSDGLSFEIFQQSPVKTPVIFITGYDQFMMNAFEYNGIDYLLKPVDRENLRKAIFKYRMLEKHFTNDQWAITTKNVSSFAKASKQSASDSTMWYCSIPKTKLCT